MDQRNMTGVVAEGRDPDLDEASARAAREAHALLLSRQREARGASAGGPALHVADHDRSCTLDAISAGMMLRCGLSPLDPRATGEKQKLQERSAEQGEAFATMSLMDLCREAIRIDCQSGRDFAGRLRGAPRHGMGMVHAAFTTASLPTILGNIAHKALQAGFEDSPSTAMLWCGKKSVSDFKAHTVARLGENEDLTLLTDAGEIEHGTVGEVKDTYQADVYGRQYRFTYKDVINDDAGALPEFIRGAGEAWTRLIDDLAYTMLIANTATVDEDGAVIFHATGHASSNLSSGADSALGDKGLSVARLLLRGMTDIGGKKRANLRGKFVLVPPDLEHTLLKLIKSVEILRTGDGSTDVAYGTYNQWAGAFQPIVEPRLSDTGFHASASATAWYLLANQVGAAQTLVLSFLQGKQTPTLEQINPNVIPDALVGLAWRVYGAVGADVIGWRGIIKSAGA